MKARYISIFIAIIGLICCVSADAAKPRRAKAKNRTAPDASELLDKAEKAFQAYDFTAATEQLDAYNDAYGTDGPQAERAETLGRLADLGSTMLGRVERIAVIDSLTVDRDRFFKAYRLSDPTGYIAGSEVLPPNFTGDNGSVYITENGETMIWSRPDGKGHHKLVESHLLADGSWETPRPLGSAFDGFDAAYPFLMTDGSTLYFAAKGDESLGGYDIFISRNNGDEYLQPQNMGMPYNSPYDDYLLVIDEQTGAGWWATDRNRIDGKITIYVFVPQELRVNYPLDFPDLAAHAFITDISRTGDGKTDHSAILRAIKALGSRKAEKEHQFDFAMPGGKIYTNLNDFTSPEAAEAMERYLEALADLTDMQMQLADMRKAYADGASNDSDILRLENQIDSQRILLQRRANAVVTAETGIRD